ncbi:MAG: lysylphosphatidylglycerol synthase transmembrane domain-containing protein, partial [Patescibacteria group bacterium]
GLGLFYQPFQTAQTKLLKAENCLIKGAHFNMKKYIVILISLLIGLIGLIILYQQVGIKDIFSQLSKLQSWQFLIIFATSLFIMILTTERWKLIVEDFAQIKPSWSTIIKARLGELAISYLTPIMYFGGEGVRAYILNKDKEIPISVGLSTVLIDRISEFIGAFIFIFFGAIFLLMEKSFIWGLFLFILAFIIFLFLYLVIELIGLDRGLLFIVKIFRLDKVKYKSKNVGETTIGERLVSLAGQVGAYLQRSRFKFYLIVILSCLSLIVWLWQTKLLINFLGFNLPWGKIFIIKIILALSGFIPIPADLGAYEGAHVLAFNIFGLPAEAAIALSIVTRAFDLLWVSIGIFLISHLVVELMANLLKIFKIENNKSSDESSTN